MRSLERFVEAQESIYEIALQEIKNGRKESHWMWYIFPQLKGLGRSYTSDYYGIDGIDEAKEYYNNEKLRHNLIEISEALLELDTCNAEEIFGYIDAIKLCSCMTLFATVTDFNNNSVFTKVLSKFFNNESCKTTLELLNN